MFGGKLVSYDEAAIKNMRGVKGVVRVEAKGGISAVAVVADTWWRAKTALDKLPIVWDEGANASVSSKTIAAHLQSGIDAVVPLGSVAGRVEGDALGAIAKSAKKVEATYFMPFVSHAPMEPMGATVKLTADTGGKLAKAECWVGTQNGEASRRAGRGSGAQARAVRRVQDGHRRRLWAARRQPRLRVSSGRNR